MAAKRSGLSFVRKLALKHVCRPGRRSWRLIMKRVPLVKFSGCLLRHSRKVSQTRRRNNVVGYSLVEKETTIDIIEKKAGLLSNRQDGLDEIPDLSRAEEEAFDAFLKSLNKCLDFILEFQSRKLALKHVCRPGRRSWRLIMKRVPLVKFSGCLLRHSRKVSQTRRRNKVVGYSLVEKETTIDIIEKKAGLLSNRQDGLDETPDLSRAEEEAFDAFLKSLNKCLDFILEFQSSMRAFRHSQKVAQTQRNVVVCSRVEKETSFNMVEEKVDLSSDRLDRLAQVLAQSRAEEKAFVAFLESFYKCCVFIKELKACHRKTSSSKPLDH